MAANVQDPGVCTADQPFVRDSVTLIAVVIEDSLCLLGDVLVKLDSHRLADRVWISCLASQAL